MNCVSSYLSTARLLASRQRIAELAASDPSAAIIQRLRRSEGEAAARSLLEIAREQSRAIAKFGPGVWMVTVKAVRQATDRVVARYKASLFGDLAVADLCCGIGGDALALARRGPLVAIDADPALVAMTAANLLLDQTACPPDGDPQDAAAIGVCADVTRYRLDRSWAIHLDPDRRPTDTATSRQGVGPGRVVRPELYSPPLESVARLVEGRPAWLVKLAPAASLPCDSVPSSPVDRWVDAGHRQWVSFGGSVREQLWMGGEALRRASVEPGGRSAISLHGDGCYTCFATDARTTRRLAEVDRQIAQLDEPPAVICDLDPAVRAAGLSACLAEQRGLAALGGPAGFFGAATAPADRSLLQCFETLWAGPADLRRIKGRLRAGRWRLGDVKTRGSDRDAHQWTLRLRGDRKYKRLSDVAAPRAAAVTLLVGRHRHGHYAVIARRLPPAESGPRPPGCHAAT